MEGPDYYMNWTDWNVHFNSHITEKLGTIMELGCGDGTPFLFNYAEKVVSLEMLDDTCANWLGNIKVPEGADWSSEYFLTDDNYNITPSIKRFITTRINKYKPDLVFVDPGIHCRGAMVQHLFGKVDMIAAHDTNQNNHNGRQDPYGWALIKPPKKYEVIHFQGGLGTTFWRKHGSTT